MDRKTQIIDASGQAVGRLATRVATILIGKHRPGWRTNIDSGDFVQVKNIDALKFTGKKLDQKEYFHYSGYPGGMKTRPIRKVIAQDRSKVLKSAVRRMLPKNTHLISRLKRLKVV